MRYEDENIWLTQKMMVTLYDVGANTINYHIKKIFKDSELQENSVVRKFRITAADGKSYSTNHYSLEIVIAIGFKVNSATTRRFYASVQNKMHYEVHRHCIRVKFHRFYEDY